jgi:hypothetical protein
MGAIKELRLLPYSDWAAEVVVVLSGGAWGRKRSLVEVGRECRGGSFSMPTLAGDCGAGEELGLGLRLLGGDELLEAIGCCDAVAVSGSSG